MCNDVCYGIPNQRCVCTMCAMMRVMMRAHDAWYDDDFANDVCNSEFLMLFCVLSHSESIMSAHDMCG